MKDVWFGEPGFGNRLRTLPGEDVLLTAAAQSPTPSSNDLIPEGGEGPPVGWHGVIIEVAADHLFQPFPLLGNRLMHALSQLLLDGLQLRPHAVAESLPLDQELAPTRPAADKDEAQKAEGLRLAEPTALAVVRRMAPD